MSDATKALPHMLIRPHLGLGDAILCNAVFRAYAAAHEVFIPCKSPNCVSIRFMLRDLPNVTILPVDGDVEADHICRVVASEGHSVLRLGMFGGPPYSPATWDRDMFSQAKVPFEHRWSEWKCAREPERELTLSGREYAFIHDDRDRGFEIDPLRLPKELAWEFATPKTTNNIFDWCGIIENATELHLIDSCFAILADSLPNLKARRKVIHLYSRKGAEPPSYRQDWEILKQ